MSVHDRDLLHALSDKPQVSFSEPVWRSRPVGLDAITPSNVGGRWASSEEGTPVLYTSLKEDGSLAEIAFHWSRMTPIIKRPVELNKLKLTTEKTLRLIKTDLESLGVDLNDFQSMNYEKTAEIGEAVAWLGCDGLISPSARWDSDNLMIYTNNLAMNNDIEVVEKRTVDWIEFARRNGFLNDDSV